VELLPEVCCDIVSTCPRFIELAGGRLPTDQTDMITHHTHQSDYSFLAMWQRLSKRPGGTPPSAKR